MSIHSISSREFTARVAEAKRWAIDGPVFITDRGQPSHVLLSLAAYQGLNNGPRGGLARALAMPEPDGIDFDPPKVAIGLRVPDLGDDDAR